MKKALRSIYRFYADGFKAMTIGRTLWLVIIVKLVIMFAVLKLFFFQDVLSERYDSDREKARAVRSNLIGNIQIKSITDQNSNP